MANPTIRFKRGTQSSFASVGLQTGEPAFITDELNFYIGIDGNSANNKFFGSHRYWAKETASKGSGINLVEATGGTDYITIAAPASVGAAVTYYFPATQGSANTVLTNDGSGNLTWGSGSQNAVFTGITTVNGSSFDVNVNSDFSGITTFSNTTDNTLGNSNTGSVQIDGGLGVDKNVTVGGNLNVQGQSEFVGVVTFKGGIINLGDSDTDDIVFGGEIKSNIVPTDDATYDIGIGSKRWRHSSFSGIGTYATGLVADTVRLGIGGNGVVDTSTGPLYLDSQSGTTIVNDHLDVYGDLDVQGNVYIGGTSISLRGQDVFIENRDIVLGYTTTTSPTDTSANHGGVAIASTEGSPLANFNASGINTLPSTYKQMMWFKSGTLGFSTDAFAFNYAVAVGTTQMASGVRFAVGTGVTVGDTSVSATNFYGTLNGNVIGSVSSADQVKTVTASDNNATYYVTFVDSHNGSATAESVYTDDAIYYNPGSNKLTTGNADFLGSVNVVGVSSLGGDVNLGNSGSDLITVVGVTTFTTSNVYINNQLYVGGLQIVGGAAITGEDIIARHINLSGIATVAGLIDGNGGANISGGETILSSATVSDLTSGRVVLAGASGSLQDSANLTYSGNGLIVGAGGINVTGVSTFSTNVTASGDLTVGGNLYVNGSTTQVNTTALTVEDRTIELGVVDGTAPGSATTWDLGVLFNYNSSGAKKSAVIWEHGDSRFKFASVLDPDTDGTGTSTPQLTVTTFAPIEIGELWVNNACTGGSDVVIGCSGGELQLQNIVVDGGSF